MPKVLKCRIVKARNLVRLDDKHHKLFNLEVFCEVRFGPVHDVQITEPFNREIKSEHVPNSQVSQN